MAVCGYSGVRGWGMVPGWVYWWVYRVGNTGSPSDQGPAARGGSQVQRSGPGRPAGPGVVVPGSRTSWTRTRNPRPLFLPPTTPCGRARAPAGPWWEGGLLAAKGRDLTSYLRNLVKTSECHRKVLKRPVIVPISKTGSIIHLLIFWDFHYSQPSLTRN